MFVYSYIWLNDTSMVQKMRLTATLSSKFQISIPKSLREAQHWRAGQEFVFIPKGEGVVMMPVPTLEQLRGIARGADTQNIRDRDECI